MKDPITLPLYPGDEAANFDIQPDFERFNQRDDVFRRSWWDASIRSKKTKLFYETYREPLKTWRKADGFTQKDYAFRNAAWHVSDIFTELKENQDRREGFSDEFTLYRDIAKEKLDVGTPQEAAAEIKRVGKAFGADLIGITEFDERWMYVNLVCQAFNAKRSGSAAQCFLRSWKTCLAI